MKVRTILTLRAWDGLAGKITEPQDIEKVFSVGDKLSERDLGGFIGAAFVIKHPVLEITSVDDNKIEIQSSGLVTEGANGGIDLMKSSTNSNFTILIGESLKLVSQSMDSGFSIIIKPIEVVTD